MLLWCFARDFVDKSFKIHTLLQNSISVRQRLLLCPRLTMCLLMDHAITRHFVIARVYMRVRIECRE